MGRSADKLYLDVPYNNCRILGSPCTNGDCRVCTVPMVLPDKARKILNQDDY